ncbi:MAG: YdcF family protein, partial [Hyphomonadaceae bacterium]|nr:YdcF family protein [Hyphomonadaceae bacterium]
GVYPRATDADIAKAFAFDPELIACCVDLGREASDTIGNASETAAWATAHGYNTILLVTEDYHMPRSLLELQLAMPAVRIIPYPVASRLSKPSLWRNDPKIAGRLALEYLKLLVIHARELVLQGGRGKPPAPPVKEH